MTESLCIRVLARESRRVTGSGPLINAEET
jgi:hypothetical protein